METSATWRRRCRTLRARRRPEMNAVHATAPSRFNRRELILWEETTVVPDAKERDVLGFKYKERIISRSTSTSPGDKSERVSVPMLEKLRKKDMTTRILRSYTTPGERSRVIDPCQVKETSDTPAGAVANEVPEMDTVPEIVPSEMDSFVRALILGGNASTLARAHVCPYHLFFSVAGGACKNVDTLRTGMRRTSLYDILSEPSSRSNKMGWLAAAAAAHNKEQHALNGNINTILSARFNAVNQYAAYRDGQGVQIDRLTNDADLIGQACDTSSPCFLPPGTEESHYMLTNVATVHQFVGVTEDMLGWGLGTGKGDVRRREPDPSSEGSIRLQRHELASGGGPSGIRTAGPVVVSDITLRPTDSDDTVAHTAGGTGPEGNRGSALEMCARISRRLKWVGVAQHIFKYVSGRLEFITYGEAPFPYGQIIDCPNLTWELLWAAPRMETGDIRELTWKVALMDMQRERRFSQPSGVEWAWARPNVPQRDIIDLSSLGHWHYDAIFVNCKALEYAVLNNGRVPVGTEGDYWNILPAAATTVIGLPSNTGAYNMGRTAWILAHLTYPLAWVLEYFDMTRLGKNASMNEVFCHTASLVDMPSNNHRHLIFVIPSNIETSVSVGGRSFPIGTIDHHLPDNRRPQAWNLDEQISVMLREALNSRNSLRRDFEEFIRPMVLGEINWLEVDSLINLLTVRYHQRGAPRGSLMSMGLRPAQHITDESYADYGGESAVTALGHRVCSQMCARQHSIVTIGIWNMYAELCMTTGLAYYSLHNTENAQNIKYRVA